MNIARRPAPGIPITEDQAEDNRRLPLDAAPIPATLGDGWQVIAFAFTPARHGEKPNLAAAVVRQMDKPILRAYAVMQVAASQGGEWDAFNGTYDCAYGEAMGFFVDRLRSHIR